MIRKESIIVTFSQRERTVFLKSGKILCVYSICGLEDDIHAYF